MNYKAYAQDEIKEARAEARAEGRAEGMNDGALLQLVKMVATKRERGKSVEQIASELEQNVVTVQYICDALIEYSLDEEEELIAYLKAKGV